MLMKSSSTISPSEYLCTHGIVVKLLLDNQRPWWPLEQISSLVEGIEVDKVGALLCFVYSLEEQKRCEQPPGHN
jgi:hypothetical protein